jgi:glycogen synthase
LTALLRQLSIPVDVPLFLSFARAQWYKGLDLAAELGAKLASHHGVHPVILALGDAKGQATVARAKELLETEGRPYTLLTDYPTLLPRWLMQWPLCRAVAVMSRREPFGLIPSEYRMLGPPEGLLITSNSGGLAEQTLSENEGIVLQIDGSETLGSQAIHSVLETWPKAAQLKCNLAGKRRVEESFDLKRNLSSGLGSLLSF